MIRFFHLFFSFFKIGALNELQYRANFFIQVFQSLLGLGVGLFGLALVFNQTATLAGWSPAELLAVMGVFFIMGGLIRVTIQPNMQRLMADIREGTLDYALTKPADSQVLVSILENPRVMFARRRFEHMPAGITKHLVGAVLLTAVGARHPGFG